MIEDYRKINSWYIKNHNWILLILLCVGFFVRTYKIDEFPGGLNQDEASIGYETYSILNYGIDRNGNSYPVFLEAWGSGQNALYAYLSTPFAYFFGLNAFSIRFLNALLSCLSLILIYLIFKQKFSKTKSLIALFVFAISPWSIMAARWGLESNIFPPIVLLAVFFLLKSLEGKPGLLLLASLLFAMSLYAYGTAYLFVPLFVLFILIYLLINKMIKKQIILFSAIIFIIVSLPIFLCIVINHFDYKSIHFLGITIPKLSANRTTHVFNLLDSNILFTLGKNVIRFFSIVFLQVDSYEYNAIPIYGTFYHLSTPFFLLGLISVIKNKLFLKSKTHFIFLVWLISASILGISIHANINRVNIVFFPIFYFVIIGLFQLKTIVKTEQLKNIQKAIFLLYFIYFSFFIGYYFTIFNENNKSRFAYGLGNAIRFAELNSSDGNVNITDNTINMPYIYACFYSKTNPNIFHKTVEYEKSTDSAFKSVRSFAHYTFGSYNHNADVRILSLDEIKYGNYNRFTKYYFGNYCVIDQREKKH